MTQALGKEELIIKTFQQLSPENQQEVIDFAEKLADHKEEDFFALAGIWENREITTESLRKTAWGEDIK